MLIEKQFIGCADWIEISFDDFIDDIHEFIIRDKIDNKKSSTRNVIYFCLYISLNHNCETDIARYRLI